MTKLNGLFEATNGDRIGWFGTSKKRAIHVSITGRGKQGKTGGKLGESKGNQGKTRPILIDVIAPILGKRFGDWEEVLLLDGTTLTVSLLLSKN